MSVQIRNFFETLVIVQIPIELQKNVTLTSV